MRLYQHPSYKNYACDIEGNIYSKYKPYDMMTRSDGTFIGHRLSKKFNKINAYTRKDGYVNFMINGKRVFCHRFVYECVTNKVYRWYNNRSKSKLVINHINSVKNDNRFCNLELTTFRRNIQIGKKRKDNLPRGVCLNTRKDRYVVQISVNGNGRCTYFGTYKTLDEAYAKSKEIYKKYFNEII